MIHVIGSGPAGVAATMALLARGRRVTMIDAGRELEPDRRAVVEQLQRQPKAEWDPQHLAAVRHGVVPSKKGIPLKLTYGSDYPYRGVDAFLPLDKRPGVDTAASFARGGFSNVWGAAVLPFRQEDIADWPVTADDLAPHYRAVFDFVPLSGRQDDLADHFPLHGSPDPLKPSAQARAFLSDLQRHRDPLRAAGMYFGAARLAARASPQGGRPGCVYCGLCMYGCPHELIYSSAHTLDRQLLPHPNFTYVPNVVVRRVAESGDAVTLEAVDATTQMATTIRASRVLLACGTIATTRLLLESLRAHDRPLTCLDSQYYLFPLLRYARPASPARTEDLHTLAQLFFEITDPELGPHTVHLQAYTYNDLYLAALKQMSRGAYPLLKWPIHALAERLIVLQGYLHSDLSPRIVMRLDPPKADGSPGVLHLTRGAAPVDSAALVKRVIQKFMIHRRQLRAVPIPPMVQIAPAGRGFHSGGTFPMTRAPGDFQSDTLGRVTGFARVHAVDATVLPSIPATTITLPVMANAHRIATRIAEREPDA